MSPYAIALDLQNFQQDIFMQFFYSYPVVIVESETDGLSFDEIVRRVSCDGQDSRLGEGKGKNCPDS